MHWRLLSSCSIHHRPRGMETSAAVHWGYMCRLLYDRIWMCRSRDTSFCSLSRLAVEVQYATGISEFEEFRLLWYTRKNSVRTSKKIHYVFTTETSRFSRRWLWRMPSSGILRRVTLVRTGVTEELSAYIIRVTRISNRRTLAPLTTLWLSDPSTAILKIISYCLIWDWVPFVAFCSSQGYSGGILSRLHAGLIHSRVKFKVIWCLAFIWYSLPISLSFPWKWSWRLQFLQYGATSLKRDF
jgi:hypothetical protein